MSLEIGQVLEGKYRIVKLIGEGGMGAVYEGENVRIRRRVAIKVLHSAFTGNSEVMQRFEREAQAAGHIGNDHILEVLDLGGLPNGDFYMVMEFLDGEPLSSRIEKLGRIEPRDLAPLAKQMLKGLGAAHSAGIVHRDLKPDNIFILREKAGKSDFVKIIDFGISKFQPLSGDGMKMTRTGAVMGTPYYMSPEQASGSHEADARSDVYAVGVILYEAVTGRVPFDASTFNQLLFKIVLSEIPPPQSIVPDLDPAFVSIITKAMARDPAHRFQSCQEFTEAIDAWMDRGKSVSAPPPADPRKHMPEAARAPLQPTVSLEAGGSAGTMGRVTTGAAGNWSTSPDHEVEPPKKKMSPLVIGALAAVVVAGVGGVVAFGAFSAVGSSDAQAEASAQAPNTAAAPAAEPPAAETTKAPEPSVAPAASAEQPQEKPKEEPAAAPAPVAAKRAARRPAAAPKAAAPPPTTSTKTTTATKTTSKSSAPDFGY